MRGKTLPHKALAASPTLGHHALPFIGSSSAICSSTITSLADYSKYNIIHVIDSFTRDNGSAKLKNHSTEAHREDQI